MIFFDDHHWIVYVSWLMCLIINGPKGIIEPNATHQNVTSNKHNNDKLFRREDASLLTDRIWSNTSFALKNSLAGNDGHKEIRFGYFIPCAIIKIISSKGKRGNNRYQGCSLIAISRSEKQWSNQFNLIACVWK